MRITKRWEMLCSFYYLQLQARDLWKETLLLSSNVFSIINKGGFLGVFFVPQTEPTRCRDGGTGDQTPPRGCPWTPPRRSRPSPSTQCASPAFPVTAEQHSNNSQRRTDHWNASASSAWRSSSHLPPRRVPRRLSGLGGFPQGKVIGGLFLTQPVSGDAQVTCRATRDT